MRRQSGIKNQNKTNFLFFNLKIPEVFITNKTTWVTFVNILIQKYN